LLPFGEAHGNQAGFGHGVGVWEYLLTQCRAVVWYLRLAFWPDPLVLDYGANLVIDPWQVWPQGLTLIMLFGATLYALWRRWVAGFLGSWFFFILAPSSSIIPLTTQTMAEHRMYLPLAALIVPVVLGVYRWVGRRAIYIGVTAALALGMLTVQRNEEYRSEEELWISALQCEIGNPRVYYNLGLVYEKLGLPTEALSEYQHALALQPNERNTLNNLGLLLAKLGDYAGAENTFRQALHYKFDDREVHYNYGNLLLLHGQTTDAATQYQAALRTDPDYAPAHNNLGAAFLKLGRDDDAIHEFSAATRLEPGNLGNHYNLANTLLRHNRFSAAIPEYEAVLQMQPNHAEAHYELGVALANSGRMPEAIPHFEIALKIKPAFKDAQAALELTRRLSPSSP
jgi:tetratricopeptide (TPR) repeat protein